jgi:hypothetical protein
VSVAVDVDRVGAGDPGEVRAVLAHRRERQWPADVADVAEQARRVGAAGEVEVRTAVVVAVEHRDAAADVELEPAVVDVLDTGAERLLDQLRDGGSRRLPGREEAAGESEHQTAGSGAP